MRYIVATIAGVIILFVFAAIGASLGWMHGGGILIQAILWLGIIAPTWRFIVKNWDGWNGHTKSTAVSHGQTLSRQTTKNQGQMNTGGATVDDTPLYAQAMAECTDRLSERNPGLWAKAFAIAEGDENRAKAKYIELRAADLSQQARKEDDELHRALNAQQLPESLETVQRWSHTGCERWAVTTDGHALLFTNQTTHEKLFLKPTEPGLAIRFNVTSHENIVIRLNADRFAFFADPTTVAAIRSSWEQLQP